MPIDLSHQIIQPPPKKVVKLHPLRRAAQVALGVALVLFPITNTVRVDMTIGKFWLLGQEFSAQNLMLLFYGCALGAILLLSVSMVYGRWWCGWICPQTLASDFGDSLLARLDSFFKPQRSHLRQFLSKGSWSLLMVLTAVSTASVVCTYFYPPARVWKAVIDPLHDSRIAVHLAIISFIIGGDLLWVRRHFCRRGCPYGLMLSLIGDNNTMTVRYLWERDEDCIKCGKCETVCPMGIDIKQGANQMECIGCGECIDACNDILPMIKNNPKPGLIELRYGLDPMRLSSRMTFWQKIGLWDARRIFLCGVTTALLFGFLFEMFGTGPTTLSVAPSGTISEVPGFILERYNLSISNGKPDDAKYTISVGGVTNLQIDASSGHIYVPRSATKTFNLIIAAPVSSLAPGQRYPITIAVHPSSGDKSTYRAQTIFYAPTQLKAG